MNGVSILAIVDQRDTAAVLCEQKGRGDDAWDRAQGDNMTTTANEGEITKTYLGQIDKAMCAALKSVWTGEGVARA